MLTREQKTTGPVRTGIMTVGSLALVGVWWR